MLLNAAAVTERDTDHTQKGSAQIANNCLLIPNHNYCLTEFSLSLQHIFSPLILLEMKFVAHHLLCAQLFQSVAFTLASQLSFIVELLSLGLKTGAHVHRKMN